MLSYVVLKTELGLCYNGNCGMEIPVMYVDADWAGDCTSRKSTNGCVILITRAAVSWYSRKNEVVALYSTEAEYVTLCSRVEEIM